MVKYNYFKMEVDGKQLIFVTRGNTKPFTEKEALDFINNHCDWDFIEEGQKCLGFEPTNTKVFTDDLKQGIDFCVSKYGVSKNSIESYIRAKMNHINPKIYEEKE